MSGWRLESSAAATHGGTLTGGVVMVDRSGDSTKVVEHEAARGRVQPEGGDRDPFVTRRDVAGEASGRVAPSSGPGGTAGPVVVSPAPSGRMGVPAVLILLLGAWGGIVPFVGPTFGFSADGSSAWTWNLMHGLLWVVPGAAACLGAVAALGLIPRFARGVGHVGASGAGLLVAVAGAWFVVGPVAWPVLQHSAGVFVPASPLRELAYQVGYSLGPGVLITLLGGTTLGWAFRGRRTALERPARGARLAA